MAGAGVGAHQPARAAALGVRSFHSVSALRQSGRKAADENVDAALDEGFGIEHRAPAEASVAKPAAGANSLADATSLETSDAAFGEVADAALLTSEPHMAGQPSTAAREPPFEQVFSDNNGSSTISSGLQMDTTEPPADQPRWKERGRPADTALDAQGKPVLPHSHVPTYDSGEKFEGQRLVSVSEIATRRDMQHAPQTLANDPTRPRINQVPGTQSTG
jgi:hypothetical protein